MKSTANNRRRKATQKPSGNGHDPNRIVRKRVASLNPSPENGQLYDVADNEDSDLIELAKSIRTKGLKEPLVVTLDNYIISGHRRHRALKMNGQVFARCRVVRVRWAKMATDDYIALLREHNRQRAKSVVEQIREVIVDFAPPEASSNLSEREWQSVNGYQNTNIEIINIEGESRRWNISDAKADHVKFIKQVIFEDRRDYWPLSVRGVHYPLLNYKFWRNIPERIRYRNDDNSYSKTSDLLTRLRLNGTIPWEAIDDETRPFTEYAVWPNARDYVRAMLDGLFDDYFRDLTQSQPNYIECLVEKNTILQMACRVTARYRIKTGSARGFNGIDLWHDLNERFKASGKERLILIVMSDFDPEGEVIPHVAGRTLRDNFGISNLDIVKAAVTKNQIERYKLPEQNFAKESSSNREWFVKRNGGNESVYELEAIHPDAMLKDLEWTIQNVLDMQLFRAEAARENEERPYLDAKRREVMEILKGLEE